MTWRLPKRNHLLQSVAVYNGNEHIYSFPLLLAISTIQTCPKRCCSSVLLPSAISFPNITLV